MWTPKNRVTPVKGVPLTESSSLEKKSAQDVHIASRYMRYEISNMEGGVLVPPPLGYEM